MIVSLVTTLLLLFLTSFSVAQDPEISWEILWADYFNDVHETSSGDFIVAGWNAGDPFDDKVVFLFNENGSLVWEYGNPSLYYQQGLWVEQTTDGGFIVTGSCKTVMMSTYALMLLRLDSNSNLLWCKVYDIEESGEIGYCVLPLPDGGFAVCGEKNPDDGMNQAWILRTDANGDTLWTREWGWIYNDKAKRVLLVDDALTVMIHGRLQSTSGGPHLIRYDLDGNLLSETPIPDWYGHYGEDMCYTSTDACYTVIATKTGHYYTAIIHADSAGGTHWFLYVPDTSRSYGYSINTTMDGGYIYAGQNLPDSTSGYSGVVAKVDSNGNLQWTDFVYVWDCVGLFSARQLSQGGYITSGRALGQGYLRRYEPEVGIESGTALPRTMQLDVSPNPSSSDLSISYSLPETAQITLSVYDLSGRLVENLVSVSVAGGDHLKTWNPDPSLSNGCYLIVLGAFGERAVRRAVLLR